uniref:Uncharacterized protein n=1 Tax=Meloidogyne floridensis TaxID=298350 RepID=A0A915NEB2_9BILA
MDDLASKIFDLDNYDEFINAFKEDRYSCFIKLFMSSKLDVNFRTRFIKDFQTRDNKLLKIFINVFGKHSLEKFNVYIIVSELYENEEVENLNISKEIKNGSTKDVMIEVEDIMKEINATGNININDKTNNKASVSKNNGLSKKQRKKRNKKAKKIKQNNIEEDNKNQEIVEEINDEDLDLDGKLVEKNSNELNKDNYIDEDIEEENWKINKKDEKKMRKEEIKKIRKEENLRKDDIKSLNKEKIELAQTNVNEVKITENENHEDEEQKADINHKKKENILQKSEREDNELLPVNEVITKENPKDFKSISKFTPFHPKMFLEEKVLLEAYEKFIGGKLDPKKIIPALEIGVIIDEIKQRFDYIKRFKQYKIDNEVNCEKIKNSTSIFFGSLEAQIYEQNSQKCQNKYSLEDNFNKLLDNNDNIIDDFEKFE